MWPVRAIELVVETLLIHGDDYLQRQQFVQQTLNQVGERTVLEKEVVP